MPTVQSTYSSTLAIGLAGMVANMVPATFISRNVEDSGGIAFGLATAQGTEDMGCKAFGSGDTEITGITVRERSLPAEQTEFEQNDSARIMTKGAVIVEAGVAVSAGDPVYVVPATGVFRNDNTGSAIQIPDARWETSTTAGSQLAIVRLG